MKQLTFPLLFATYCAFLGAIGFSLATWQFYVLTGFMVIAVFATVKYMED
jgi:hypothetical protein